jgi:hypothetical protein
MRQTSQFNQSKNNRYQQTWHTIEFSNNRHYRHQKPRKTRTSSLRSNFTSLPAPTHPRKSAGFHRSGCFQLDPQPAGFWDQQIPFPTVLVVAIRPRTSISADINTSTLGR